MLIFRYLTREVAKSLTAVFLVLVTIFLSQKFVRYLADASEGDIPGHLVATMVGLNLPHLAALLLPLSTFLGILMAYGRIYADNEMTVLHACGVSEWYVTRVTLVLSIVMMVITGGISLYLSPWAEEKEYQVKEQADADAGISAIIPGRFQKTANEKAVVFVHDRGSNNTLKRVFVASTPSRDEGTAETGAGKTNLVYAEQGTVVEEADGSISLLLEQGKQYETTKGQASSTVTRFSSYQVQIQEQEVEKRRRKLTAVPSKDLYNDKDAIDAQAELQWRLALPLSIPILTLIAVPLSVVNPRQGKFAKMLPAILLYLGYFLLLSAGKSAMEDEVTPSILGLWWIHLSALGIGGALLVKGRPLGSRIRATFKRGEA